MGEGGDSGIAVEAFEVLPYRLAPIDEGVWMGRPVVGLRSCLHVDVVEHRLDSGNYGVELTPLGSGLLLQHVELCLGPSIVFYRHQKDSSYEEITSATTLTMNYSPFSSSASFFARPDAFSSYSWS